MRASLQSSLSLSVCAGVASLLVLCPRVSLAYCQATTCQSDDCRLDEQTGCKIEGAPVSWRRGCVSFSVHSAGSKKREISAQQLEDVLLSARDEWWSASCGDADLGLELVSLGEVECGTTEFNSDGPNANVWLFRDDDWPWHDDEGFADSVAYSVVTFNTESGEILDVDVEINSANLPLSLRPERDSYDLRSVVTHEMGHFLGLDHTQEDGAIMNSRLAMGQQRHELSTDDEQAICSLYGEQFAPDKEDNCSPLGGFSEQCAADMIQQSGDENEPAGCTHGVATRRTSSALQLWLLSGAVLLLARRRKMGQG